MEKFINQYYKKRELFERRVYIQWAKR